MFKKEKYLPTIYSAQAYERASTGLRLIETVTGLGEEEVINNALQVHADLQKKEEELVYQKKEEYYTELDRSPAIPLKDIAAEKLDPLTFPLGKALVTFRLQEKTKEVLGDKIPETPAFEEAITTYVAIVGHSFVGEKVLTQKKVQGKIWSPSYQTTPVETHLTKQVEKTKKEPPYKGRHIR